MQFHISRISEGVQVYKNGDVYEGEFHQGKCSGSGVYYYYMSGRYEGDWVDGKYDGYGVETWAKGSRYRGQYRQGMRHGYGVYRFYTGDVYTGEWSNGQSHGYGVHTCEDGSRYVGEFKWGVKHGLYHFRCSHYRRRCQIRAPSCNEVFDCRNCHNEAKNSMDVHPHDRHNVLRHEVRKVICSHCRTEQDVQQTCVTCGVCMGKYFCEKCNFFDDEDSKQQYHCDGCGICRTGGNDNFFHCYKCGCCHSIRLKDCHPCVEKAMHHNCPLCFEDVANAGDIGDSLHPWNIVPGKATWDHFDSNTKSDPESVREKLNPRLFNGRDA